MFEKINSGLQGVTWNRKTTYTQCPRKSVGGGTAHYVTEQVSYWEPFFLSFLFFLQSVFIHIYPFFINPLSVVRSIEKAFYQTLFILK